MAPPPSPRGGRGRPGPRKSGRRPGADARRPSEDGRGQSRGQAAGRARSQARGQGRGQAAGQSRGQAGGQGRSRSGGSGRSADRSERSERRPAGDGAELRGPRRWGGLARRGAGREGGTSASDAWRAVGREVRRDSPRRAGGGEATTSPRWQPEEWIDEGELRDEAAGAVGRSRSGPSRPGPRRRDAAPPAAGARRDRDGAAARADDAAAGDDDVRRAVAPNRLARFESRLKDASTSFRRERYEEARRILRPLAEQAPGAASVRELYGLTLYRLGRWAQAKRELEAFRTQTGSTGQHPVLADCYRALGRYAEVEELWDELRQASPSAELVAEGRIVAAGALADQGRLDDAIRLLEAAAKPTRRPKLHHLRLAYASADLYERAGDLPRARELFGLVATNDPDFVDVQARLRALR